MRVCVSREGGLTRAEAAPALLAADAAPATAIAAPVACGSVRVVVGVGVRGCRGESEGVSECE